MKAIAAADLHLNINNRFEDTKAVLRQMTTYAIENKIEKFWILGDIYDRKRPYNSEKILFNQFVKSLADHNIDVTIISGNHDIDKYQASALGDVEVWDLPNVKILPNPSVVAFNGHNVYLGHFLVNGAKLGPLNYSMNHAVNLDWILKTPADIYLLGDIHKAQELNTCPSVLYAGSPERVDFGERNEVKGFALIDSNEDLGGGPSYKFIPLETRPMIQIENNGGGFIDPLPDTKEAIVKVKFNITKDQYKNVNEKKIRADIFPDVYSLKFEYNITREDRVRNANISESVEPASAFMEYAQEKQLDENTINAGLEIIQETK